MDRPVLQCSLDLHNRFDGPSASDQVHIGPKSMSFATGSEVRV